MPGAHRFEVSRPTSGTERIRTHLRANRRRALALLGAFGFAVFVPVWLVSAATGAPLLGLVIAAGAAAALTALLYSRADGMAKAGIGGSPADPVVHARLHNVVEGLCSAGGLTKPSLLVVDDEAPNAVSLGRDHRHATLVVTSGLMSKLSRIELEGVLAHELSHVKNGDTLVSTLCAALVGRMAPRLVPVAIGPERESLADVTGVALTRYPPGLISALEKLRDDPSVLRSSPRGIAQLWIDAPNTGPSCPSLDERIQALREL